MKLSQHLAKGNAPLVVKKFHWNGDPDVRQTFVHGFTDHVGRHVAPEIAFATPVVPNVDGQLVDVPRFYVVAVDDLTVTVRVEGTPSPDHPFLVAFG